tara:strand:- start:681 stop:1055 length:375 start_codon:yes stop_codon:yes gene_type:complete
MKENYLESKFFYSAYFLSIYLFVIGVFNYFYSTYFFFLDEFPNAQDSSRSAFLIGGAFLFFQIYNTSKELYQRLIDSIIVMLLTLTMVYPTFCLLEVFIFQPIYLLFVLLHFLIFLNLLYDKNK